MEDRDLVTPIKEEIDAIRKSFDGHQGRNGVIAKEMMRGEEGDDSDMEVDIELMLVLFVKKSLNLSAGMLSLAGVRATTKLTLQVEELMETVAMWNQNGLNTENRGMGGHHGDGDNLPQCEDDGPYGLHGVAGIGCL